MKVCAFYGGMGRRGPKPNLELRKKEEKGEKREN